MKNKITIKTLIEMKERGEKITALTAYDVQTARLVDEAGVELILVGDSLGMVVLGYENTLPVTMEEMVHHTKAVVRGTERALVIADMPFMSYQTGVKDALVNAGRLMKEAGAHGVKLEGGREVLPQVETLVKAGIPVLGHLGLTPQSVHQLGGFKVQGKDQLQAERLKREAKELEDAGAFAIVLECIPAILAREISESLTIPTIGIGAGPYCDGQILVTQDLLGMDANFKPRFVRRYVNLHQIITQAVKEYITDVKMQNFPDEKESFSLSDSVNKTQLYSGGDSKDENS
ncbi:3-methyl-2-oxobutanoate hydroxymethyltransferase [Anoxybacter fermentans]|uniref:3-methyl-2-oxobutanoate hydroxymethyltransferase n=2 Tax=Bacteria TaxID=2 RepID=A0A3S9T294_9FIRM|nr:3-methyl-2-oxobutanoate hydroxymethyltransferase [Anoxybacter fermentans]AZR74655.1 3-methyl-2-oxobutanoate hydroxymethyltransferase [Anoxybacter fermentans]